MQDEPHPAEILQAVAAFLRSAVVPATGGALAYQARVAAAALDLACRQIARPQDEQDERSRLQHLLGQDGELVDLTAELARRLGSGELDLHAPGVAAHLWQTARAKLAVDQPRYWGLQPQDEDRTT